MLVKWITCAVPRARRAAFDRTQLAWHAIARLPGFRGQCGGWDVDRPGLARIVSVWADAASYRAFRNGPHDAVVARSRQDRTYAGIQVKLWPECTLVGWPDGLEVAVRMGVDPFAPTPVVCLTASDVDLEAPISVPLCRSWTVLPADLSSADPDAPAPGGRRDGGRDGADD